MNTNKNIAEDEIILAPPTELFEEAKQIAESTSGDDKFLFTIQYDVNEKELLLSVMEMAGVSTEDVGANTVTAWMNMTQLKLIRSLNCVERVMTNERRNKFIVREATMENLENESTFESVETAAPSSVAVPPAARTKALNLDEAAGVVTMNDDVNLQGNDGVVLAANYVSATNCCCPPTNTTMETAKTIRVESTVNGNICCPGAEQWFKFTAAKTGRHTIYTSGSLDTIGTLYDSCGNQIVEADDHEPTGSLNFRIVQNLTKDATYYLKVRVWGSGTGNYTLQVTQRVFADYVSINKDTIVLEKNVVYELPLTPNYTYKGYNGAKPIPGLSVSLSPTYADNQEIFWYVYGNNNLTCTTAWDDDGDRYWHLIASDDGIATLYAEDWAGNGKRDVCTVYMGGAPVTGISLNQSTKAVCLNDTEKLTAIVTPSNALNKGVTWDSSNWNVVDVDSNGVITGLKVGTAIISATTDEGNYCATCIVTVDKRQKVVVERDEEYSVGEEIYFNITFQDGKTWKSVGCDLSLDEYNSGNLGYGYIEWNNLYKWEQRFLDNFQNSYTEDQLAYIYYFDPLGVENYMVNINAPIYHNKSMLQRLNFKDSLYGKIFGIIPHKFYFDEDGVYSDYQNYHGWNRLDYYSNAEILFGWHRTPFDWESVVKSALSTLFDLVIGLVPPISFIQNGIMLYKYVFYGASINEFSTTLLTSCFDLYEANTMVWVISLLSAIGDATFSQFEIPNDMTVDVYQKVELLANYKTVFMIGDTKVSMSDVITHC